MGSSSPRAALPSTPGLGAALSTFVVAARRGGSMGPSGAAASRGGAQGPNRSCGSCSDKRLRDDDGGTKGWSNRGCQPSGPTNDMGEKSSRASDPTDGAACTGSAVGRTGSVGSEGVDAAAFGGASVFFFRRSCCRRLRSSASAARRSSASRRSSACFLRSSRRCACLLYTSPSPRD